MVEWLSGILSAWRITRTDLLLGFALFVLMSAGGLAAVGMFLVRIPAGYFTERAPAVRAKRRTAGGWAALVAKNILGVAIIVIGLTLTLPGVPGPGLLVLLAGFMVTDFPGKRRLERWLVSRPGVLATINNLRSRYGKPPMILDSEPERSR
jgi:hypothetical protein